MIFLLYTQDHAARAEALAQVLPGAQHGLVTTTPVAKAGLDTLIFWGHGDMLRLCGLLAPDVTKLIAAWKKLNPGLKTVEIITCNARHASVGSDPLAAQIKRGLTAGFLSATRSIVVKALPVNVGGKHEAYSILLANAPNKTWCYVTASGASDATMWEGANLVKAAAKDFASDLAQGANKVVIDVKDRKFTLNYGYFNTLRAQLGVVH